MTRQVDSPSVIPLLLALLVALAPQMFRLPLTISAWCLALWGYTALAERRAWPRPDRKVRWVLTALGAALVALVYSFRGGSSAAVGMLAVMAGLKPIEVDSHRDRMVTVFLAYFLAVTSLFDFETLAMTAFMFVSVLVTTAVLIYLNHPAGGLRSYLRASALIMAQAVPLMVILFVCFPRTYSSSWGLGGSGRGVTGFSGTLRSGDISTMARSERVAFRVQFEDRLPPANQLYWRGAVFEDFDGLAWQPARALLRQRRPVQGQQPVSYGVSLEPTDGRWLFALDLPRSAPEFAAIMSDYTLQTHRRLSGKLRYRVTSVTRYDTEDDPARRRAALRLPAGKNPRAVDLARRWKSAGMDSAGIVEQALAYFARHRFTYSLSPPALGEHAIDEFLLETREGFCEHYAAAFTVLMRAAGVPARIVGGFLGGEPSPSGNYLVVRDAHAHAWSEVWFDDRGWTRIDPTLVVAPERAEADGGGLLARVGISGRLLEGLPGLLGSAWQTILARWDLINIQWDFQVMGYSSDEQRDLLAHFGLKTGSDTAPLLMTIAGVVLAALLLTGLRYRRRIDPDDRVQARYALFCARLARIQLARRPSQGPLDYAHMVVSKRRDLKDSVEQIVGLYVTLRYGGDRQEAALRKFCDLVGKFDPRP